MAGKSVIIESLASLASSVFCYCSNINVSEDKRRERGRYKGGSEGEQLGWGEGIREGV